MNTQNLSAYKEKILSIFFRPFVSNSQIRESCRKMLDKQKTGVYNDVTINETAGGDTDWTCSNVSC